MRQSPSRYGWLPFHTWGQRYCGGQEEESLLKAVAEPPRFFPARFAVLTGARDQDLPPKRKSNITHLEIRDIPRGGAGVGPQAQRSAGEGQRGHGRKKVPVHL